MWRWRASSARERDEQRHDGERVEGRARRQPDGERRVAQGAHDARAAGAGRPAGDHTAVEVARERQERDLSGRAVREHYAFTYSTEQYTLRSWILVNCM